MQPSVKFELVRRSVNYFLRDVSIEIAARCLDMNKYGMVGQLEKKKRRKERKRRKREKKKEKEKKKKKRKKRKKTIIKKNKNIILFHL